MVRLVKAEIFVMLRCRQVTCQRAAERLYKGHSAELPPLMTREQQAYTDRQGEADTRKNKLNFLGEANKNCHHAHYCICKFI